MKKFFDIPWVRFFAPVILIALCVGLPLLVNYDLPVEAEAVEAVTIYRGEAETMEKKYITNADDIALIVKKLDSMRNLGWYKVKELPVGGNATHFVFQMKDGSQFACTFGEDLYYTDGTTKMRTFCGFLQKLWADLDYSSEPGYPDWDGYIVPQY
jgi:hypothetical protein